MQEHHCKCFGPAGNSPDGVALMRLKIGVMGGATGEFSREVLEKAHALGRAIARSEDMLQEVAAMADASMSNGGGIHSRARRSSNESEYVLAVGRFQ